jgi:large subunit ribosomal protein L4
MIEAFGTRGPWLVVVPETEDNAWKSARNVEGVTMLRACDVNAYDLLRHRSVVFTAQALELVRERVGDARATRKDAAHA